MSNNQGYGNAAAMREVLDDIVEIAKIALTVNCVGNCNDSELWRIIDKCKSVLSAPPRNCDVGTAEEQFDVFAKSCIDKDCDLCEHGIRGRSLAHCALRWAQTPYEAEKGEK